jgi:hypothetical protein
MMMLMLHNVAYNGFWVGITAMRLLSGMSVDGPRNGYSRTPQTARTFKERVADRVRAQRKPAAKEYGHAVGVPNWQLGMSRCRTSSCS